MSDNKIGLNVKAEMVRRGITVRLLSGHLGITPGALSHKLAGRRKITAAELNEIAIFLSVPIESLVSGVQPIEMPPAPPVVLAGRAATPLEEKIERHASAKEQRKQEVLEILLRTNPQPRNKDIAEMFDPPLGVSTVSAYRKELVAEGLLTEPEKPKPNRRPVTDITKSRFSVTETLFGDGALFRPFELVGAAA